MCKSRLPFLAGCLGNKRGRKLTYPRHKPTAATRAQAETLSGLGLPRDQIAALIKISEDTLVKYYGVEITVGKARANAAVADTLFNRATQGQDTTAMIWWSKAQMRWTERQEHTGAAGGPIVQEVRYSWGEPTD